MFELLILSAISCAKLLLTVIGLYAFQGFTAYSVIIALNILLNYAFIRTIKANSLQRFVLVVSEIAIPGFSSIALSVFFFSYVCKEVINRLKPDDGEAEAAQDDYKNYITFTAEKVNAESEDQTTTQSEDVTHIRPFIDILHSSNTAHKVNACINIKKVPFEDDRVRLLLKALSDEEYEVRYIANSMLNKIEREIVTEIDVLTKNIAAAPHDPKNYRLRGYAKSRFAMSPLLSKELQDFFARSSLEDFKQSLQAEPENYFLYVKLAQVYTMLGNTDELIRITAEALMLPLDTDNRNKVLFYRAEAFYQLKDLPHMTECLKRIDRSQVKYPKILAALDTWRLA